MNIKCVYTEHKAKSSNYNNVYNAQCLVSRYITCGLVQILRIDNCDTKSRTLHSRTVQLAISRRKNITTHHLIDECSRARAHRPTHMMVQSRNNLLPKIIYIYSSRVLEEAQTHALHYRAFARAPRKVYI